ncbi:MAG: protein TolQ [Candidatus Methylumidiphilus sp.]
MPLILLIRSAGPVVQAVLLLLLVASIVSWTYIIAKSVQIGRARHGCDTFEEQFWSGIDLADLYRELSQPDYLAEGMETVFLSGFKEFARLRKQPGIAPEAMVEAAQRGMRVALARELDHLDERLPFLATVGSTSPYIGLFGTVWGVMDAFHALGSAKQATLAMVAPGISEALLATAMGLFAAIPAVIAYNRHSADINRLASRYEAFADEFLSLLHRQAHSR